MKFLQNKYGFTMVQLIMTVAIISVLSASVFTWIDPLARIGEAKNKKRSQDINIIAAAITNYSGDHQGVLPILGVVATSTKKILCSSQEGSVLDCNGDSAVCLTIDDEDFYNYLAEIPHGPDKSDNIDSGYYLFKDANDNLEVGACNTYNSTSVSKTLTLKVTCPAYGGGKCWYIADSAGRDCNNVCADNNLSCINHATYGPDLDSSASGFCALNKAFGYLGENTCGSSCSSADSSSWPPVNQDGASVCYYRTYPIRCADKALGYLSICPCE